MHILNSRRLACVATLLVLTAPPAHGQGVFSRLKKKVKDKVAERVDSAADKNVDKGLDKAQGAAKPGHAPGARVWLNYDFIPGDSALYFNDFADDAVGDFPRRMELVSGNFDVVNIKGTHYLRTMQGGWVSVVLPAALPQHFTIEVTMFSPQDGHPLEIHTTDEGGRAYWGCYPRTSFVDGGSGAAEAGEEVDGLDPNAFVHCRFTVDQRYIKAYLNEHRTANVPTTHIVRTDTIFFSVPASASDSLGTLITDVRVASGGRNLYDALAAGGRVATHGILFATGSAAIEGESTPTLKAIAAMLEAHPELRLTIEGHTDNVGAAASNQALSEKRAAAVKDALVSIYGIDAARLQPRGFGSTRPVAPNTTAEGRHQNRRVELVRR